MTLNTRVKDLMIRNVVTVQPDDLMSDAVTLMFENRVSAVPVVDKKMRCQGILSTTDLVALFRHHVSESVAPDELDPFTDDLADAGRRGAWLGQHRVSEIMTGDVMTVSLESPVLDAAREMLRSRVHRLVVVDDGQRVIGILSTMDLLEAFAGEG